MKLSFAGIGQQSPEGESICSNSELWHACAGPLVSLPATGSRVVYFPQGHSEQVSASTNKEVDAHIPSYPSLPSQLVCQLHNVTMHADVETDEVFAQMTLQPLSMEEQKDASFHPADLGAPSKQPTNYFCKTLTASDTSTHGGFSVPRRAAEKVFPPLDFSQQPPCQELIARDLHDNEWKFRHIFRGQPKRHLLTTGWSVFVSAKRLVAGDSVLFIRNENNQLLLGIRRASRRQTMMPSSVLSSDSMHFGLLAAAAHAVTTNSRFTIFFNPRASPSEFVISLATYVKAVYHTRVSVGVRFRMLFETEESSVRRYMGTITGISDLDPARWPNSHWRSVKVDWNESTAGERQPRVSLWEIEPLTTFPLYPSTFPYRLKRPWPPGLSSFNDEMGMNSPLMWLRRDNGDSAIQSLNFQGMGVTPWMQPTPMLNMPNDLYQAMASAALQDIRAVDPTKQTLPSVLQFQHPINTPPVFPQSVKENQLHSLYQSQSQYHLQQQLLQQFNNQQQQQQNQHLASSTISALPHFALSSQTQSPSLQAMSQQQQNFSNSNGNPMTNSTPSPLNSFMRLFPQDESSHLLNLPRNDALSPSGWPSKRVAVDSVLPHLVPPHTSTSPNAVSLPPFPGRECSINREGNHDSHNNNLFGVNTDSTSLLMQNGITGIRAVGNDSVSMSSSFASPNNYMGTGGAARNNFSPNPVMATSSCIDESGFLRSSENLSQGNATTGTFVKVYRSGSFGRSIDISKFSSYHELRSELARMFGLEGQLEDPLRSGWQLVFVDRENDVLLLGDDPWQEFVNSVWCIKILSPEEVQEMGKRGLQLLNSVPSQKLSNNGSCDDYTNRQESRNLSSGLASKLLKKVIDQFDGGL